MIYKIALVIIIALVGFMFYKNNATPSYLGMTNGQFSPMPSSPNAVSSQTDIEEKLVAPIAYQDLDKAILDVKRVLSQLPENRIETLKSDYIHIIFTTATMKFNDDVELYFDTQAKQIHYRSQSRVGYSDRGLNRARYDQFVKLYSELN